MAVALHPRLAALTGTVVAGRYALTEVSGTGSTGVVFAGRHVTLRRKIAVKVLHPSVGSDPALAARFEREARIVSLLDHPNCCRVLDSGTTSNGLRYFVMPWLEGTSLREALGTGISRERAVSIAVQILRGLKHAHGHGVVHRDLKPENVLLTRDEEGQEVAKITDFGIAKVTSRGRATDQVTAVGMICGSPEYMSPEQAMGRSLDGRSDLYAFGLIVYEMLAGQPAFRGGPAVDVMRRQVYDEPPALDPAVPPVLREIVMRLLAKRPDDRFFDAKGALDAFTSVEVTAALRGPRSRGVWSRLRAAFGLGRRTVAHA